MVIEEDQNYIARLHPSGLKGGHETGGFQPKFGIGDVDKCIAIITNEMQTDSVCKILGIFMQTSD